MAVAEAAVEFSGVDVDGEDGHGGGGGDGWKMVRGWVVGIVVVRMGWVMVGRTDLC